MLYAREVDHRSSTFAKALEMGKEYKKRTKALVLRAAILRNQIVVKVRYHVAWDLRWDCGDRKKVEGWEIRAIFVLDF